MKEQKQSSWSIPWGGIALVSFMLGLVFCNNAASIHSAPIWGDLMIGSMVVFGVSLLFWLIRFTFKALGIMEKEGPLPWWYGAL